MTHADFDQAFIACWVEDGPVDDLGEASPHDDLASFKAMLAHHGWAIGDAGAPDDSR